MPSHTPEPPSRVLAEWERAKIAERDSTITTVSCKWCEDSKTTRPWGMTGTVKETREAYAAHRTDKHPEVKPRQRIRRRRLTGHMLNGSDLEQNIANARAQGGALWAGGNAE